MLKKRKYVSVDTSKLNYLKNVQFSFVEKMIYLSKERTNEQNGEVIFSCHGVNVCVVASLYHLV